MKCRFDVIITILLRHVSIGTLWLYFLDGLHLLLTDKQQVVEDALWYITNK